MMCCTRWKHMASLNVAIRLLLGPFILVIKWAVLLHFSKYEDKNMSKNVVTVTISTSRSLLFRRIKQDL